MCGRVRLDTSGNTTARGGRVLPNVTRPCALQRRMCTILGRFSGDGDFNRRMGRFIREVPPQDARSITFSKTGRYRDTSTLARRQWLIFRVATIFVAAHLTRTSPDRTYGQMLQ